MKTSFGTPKLWILLVLWLYPLLTAVAQYSVTEKKTISTQDYTKWSRLKHQFMTSDGNWLSYTLEYDNGNDTLFVKHIDKNKQFHFPLGYEGSFSTDATWFVCKIPDKGCVLLNLESGKEQMFKEAVTIHFADENRVLVVGLKKESGQSLLILDLNSGKESVYNHVKSYKINGTSNKLSLIKEDNSVTMVNIGKDLEEVQLFQSWDKTLKELTWSDDGTALAFLEEVTEKENILHFYQSLDGHFKKKVLNITNFLQGEQYIVSTFLKPSLVISPDNMGVFFYRAYPSTEKQEQPLVEVWNTQAPLEYKREQLSGYKQTSPKLTVWWPELHKVLPVADDYRPTAYLAPRRTRALIFNKYQFVPKNGDEPASDLWVKNLTNGEVRKVLDRFCFDLSLVGMSPNDRYVHYFKDQHWWVYDGTTDTHRNLTIGLGNFSMVNSYTGKRDLPFGFTGWSLDSRFLIVHDMQGVWLISPDGKKNYRTPNCIGKNTVLKMYAKEYGAKITMNPYDFFNQFFDVSKELILTAVSKDMASGYYLWNFRSGLKELMYDDAKISRLQKPGDSRTYLVMKEATEIPYELHIVSGDKKANKIVLKTNTHQKKYWWPTAELVNYTNSKGDSLQGILYYPADYKPDQKYPLIVYVYEKQSQDFHKYRIPTHYQTDGFNPINYSTVEYFVFYPDIVYQIGEPGYSAVDCITSAVKSVLNKKMVDQNRMGIIGHSFGGYETSFFITQSNLFVAAVAGGALIDMISNSLRVDSNGVSRMWFYQTYQGRMGNMLFEDWDGFMENSPIMHANKVETPLLSWMGKQDYHVGTDQSMSFHLALRNLNKNNVFLQYPGEGHILMNPQAQKDLTDKVRAWFDYYLKKKPIPK